MKRKILTSVAASFVVVGAMVLTGCGGNGTTTSSASNAGGSTSGGSTSGGSTSGGSTSGGTTPGQATTDRNTALITIGTANGETTVDPIAGKVVATSNNTSAAVMPSPGLSKCADTDKTIGHNPTVLCEPKENVTYIFQSDFGRLGPVDNDPHTFDGGALLYDALTEYNGTRYVTPQEVDPNEQRISEVYIPANYIVLNKKAEDLNTTAKYDLMREALANVCNMKCLFDEQTWSHSYFTPVKNSGKFRATYVMHFTRGVGEKALMAEFIDNNATKAAQNQLKDLEYLAVSFDMIVEKKPDNSGLIFKSLPGSPVTLRAKKAGQAIVSTNTNLAQNEYLNFIMHDAVDDSDNAVKINMARYFDKLVAHAVRNSPVSGTAEWAKSILVENAVHPWPVKIYGTLHEILDDKGDQDPTNDVLDRSFVRNPGELNATLFGLPENEGGQAMKFNIVYPGGDYNKL